MKLAPCIPAEDEDALRHTSLRHQDVRKAVPVEVGDGHAAVSPGVITLQVGSLGEDAAAPAQEDGDMARARAWHQEVLYAIFVQAAGQHAARQLAGGDRSLAPRLARCIEEGEVEV